jgi:hypothetical protein
MNGLSNSDAALTTESCAAHGSAELLKTQLPVASSVRRRIPRSQVKTGWCYLCTRATDEKQWRIHPDPVKVVLTSDGPTPFEVTATDIRKNRDPGTTVIAQCIVCSKQENTSEAPAPDALKSVIGASEVRTLIINAPIGPSAVIQSINNVSVDSARFISSPRLASIVARIRNLPAGAHPYLVAQPVDQTRRWVSLLQPMNGLAGDRFLGTAVLGSSAASAHENFQRYWLSVVVSHRKFQIGNDPAAAVAISNAEWDSHYAPLLQAISEEPVAIKRLPTSETCAITLNVDGSHTGTGSLNGAPLEVDKYFDAFGEVDLPTGTNGDEMDRYDAWLLLYNEADFDQFSADPSKSPVRQERAKVQDAQWSIPWASLPAGGRYVVIAVLTEDSGSPPRYITDDAVKAYSQPRLIEFKPQVPTHQ